MSWFGLIGRTVDQLVGPCITDLLIDVTFHFCNKVMGIIGSKMVESMCLFHSRIGSVSLVVVVITCQVNVAIRTTLEILPSDCARCN